MADFEIPRLLGSGLEFECKAFPNITSSMKVTLTSKNITSSMKVTLRLTEVFQMWDLSESGVLLNTGFTCSQKNIKFSCP